MDGEETLTKLLEGMQLLEKSQGMMLKTMGSLVERAEGVDERYIKLRYEVLHLKVALCLSWIGAAAYAIWSSSQC